jgi:hypothetical protein
MDGKRGKWDKKNKKMEAGSAHDRPDVKIK